MGNKANFGYIKTDKTTYEAGEQVYAEFLLKVSKDMLAYKIVMEIFGSEIAEWEELNNSMMASHKGSQLIMHHKADIYSFPTNKVVKGDYIFPFIIGIPQDIPTSTSIALPRLTGKVSYKVNVFVEGTDIAATSEILIKEKIVNTQDPAETTVQLKGCLWIERGEIYVRAKSLNDAYTSNEKLKIKVDVDTSRSSWALGSLMCTIYQVISVTSNEKHKYIRKEAIFTRSYIGFQHEMAIEIALDAIRGNLKETNSTSGKVLEIGYCVEMRGIMESIFSLYGPEPELSLWFTVLPKTEIPRMPKHSFAWKPKKIDTSFRQSAPIFS